MSKLLEGLNPEQLKAVTHKSQNPLLIIAGAGTGKTTVITRRIAYLIEQNLAQPDEILALTFTEKAAGEMEERVDQLAPLGMTDFWISTFHSFCQRILERHGLDIGLSHNFKLLDDIKQWILIHKNFEQFQLDYYKPLGSPNRFISALLDHFSKCKDELISPKEYLNYAESLNQKITKSKNPDEDQITEAQRITEIAKAYQTYQQLLLDNEYLDFADLINYCIDLFSRRPNILKQYQKQFKYILVDEFQDTNYAQYELIKLLAGNSINKKTKGNSNSSISAQKNQKKSTKPLNSLVVVGDDDQSIYKFRGASVSNILKLKEEFTKVTQITLIQNYRSSQEVLDLAYNFIQANNPDRLETKLGINKRLIANLNETQGEVKVLEANDLSGELTMVTKKILELKKSHKEASWNDFAILIRANSAAEEMIPKLDAANIPYTFVAHRGLFKKPMISNLINYLQLLDQYHESQALYQVLNFKHFAIEPEQIAVLSHYAKKKTLSLYQALLNADQIPDLTKSTQTQLNKIDQLIQLHSQQKNQKTAVEMFIAIINDLGIIEELKVDTIEAAENRELVDQFFKKIEKFEEDSPSDKSLNAFMQHLNLEIIAGNSGEIKFDPNIGPESLKLMTIHSAKGLEFKYTFMINMVDQRFPTRAKSDPISIPEPLIKDILPEGNAHLQEERRLFYVALTRAKTNLYLSWSKDYGGSRPKKPSLFLDETKLVPSEKVNTATGKVVFTTPTVKKENQKTKKQIYKNIPSVFSFSSISAFRTCPLSYKYEHYLKLPLPGAPSLSFGVSIHNTFQKFAQSFLDTPDLLPDFQVLQDIYETEFIDEWYNDKQEKTKYYQEGIKMLKTVYDDFTINKPQIKYIEQKFSLKLKDYTITGRIDRVDNDQNQNLIVVDYKTGKSKKTKNKQDVDQLKLYQWALSELAEHPVSQMYYWYLLDNQKQEEKIASPEQIEQLQLSILETIDEIVECIKYDLFEEKHQKLGQHFCRYQMV
ncbi:MAG: ATP-dependent DNA helicase [Candidatus Doudnabacteria bacterium]